MLSHRRPWIILNSKEAYVSQRLLVLDVELVIDDGQSHSFPGDLILVMNVAIHLVQCRLESTAGKALPNHLHDL